jgi:hypothetical protein
MRLEQEDLKRKQVAAELAEQKRLQKEAELKFQKEQQESDR